MAKTTLCNLPKSTSVVIVGAGLSGLSAARELTDAGVDDFVVIEAQQQVGGRIRDFVRDDGTVLMRGGEFTGPIQAELHKLAAKIGIAWEPIPSFAQHPMGKFVRVHEGKRYVEVFPLADDPEAAAQYAAAAAALNKLIAEVPHDKPWTAPQAHALDKVTIGAWMAENVPNAAAFAALASGLVTIDLHVSSVLYVAWFLSGFGSWEAYAGAYPGRFVGGSAQIPQRLAADLGDKVQLSTPVRRIRRTDSGVTVDTDRGSIDARALILAIEPGQCAKIEFEPVLPAARDRLQARWLGGHGAKFFAIYDKPFWRDDGLAGFAGGLASIPTAVDMSPSDGSEGIMCAFFFATNDTVAENSLLLQDPHASREMVLAALEQYFGPKARAPKEFHAFNWSGHRWSEGCGSQVPLGVLSTLGSSLREPVGPIHWAGNDTGEQDFMEGAVTSGQRAAREIAKVLKR